MPVTAVVMVGAASAETAPVTWVQQARRAATRDLLEQLARQTAVERIILVSPEPDELAGTAVTDTVITAPGAIHVGRQLQRIVEAWSIERLLYFGGGSAPLLEDETVTHLVTRLSTGEPMVVTNNRYASDWAGISPARSLLAWTEQLPKDNMLGWILSSEAGLPAHTYPVTAATRLDIDTPTDLLILSLHPRTKEHLRHYLAALPLDRQPLRKALAVLGAAGSHVFVAGRIGPDVWSALNRATQVWLRVVAEERGMVSSGRQSRGEVFSLLAEHITAVGMARFFAMLAQQAAAAFIDTRPLLAHHGRWPAEADRYASDLGLADQVTDAWLQEFTRYAAAAPLPVILGGHSLMAGDMLALCEML
jgi:CTP:molybdopterin cytidylyltransferase MocA